MGLRYLEDFQLLNINIIHSMMVPYCGNGQFTALHLEDAVHVLVSLISVISVALYSS